MAADSAGKLRLMGNILPIYSFERRYVANQQFTWLFWVFRT